MSAYTFIISDFKLKSHLCKLDSFQSSSWQFHASVSPHKFLSGVGVWVRGGGGYIKSWTSYPGRYSDLSEGATKTKSLKVDSLIM